MKAMNGEWYEDNERCLMQGGRSEAKFILMLTASDHRSCETTPACKLQGGFCFKGRWTACRHGTILQEACKRNKCFCCVPSKLNRSLMWAPLYTLLIERTSWAQEYTWSLSKLFFCSSPLCSSPPTPHMRHRLCNCPAVSRFHTSPSSRSRT